MKNYQTYVKHLTADTKSKLLWIPLLVAFLTYLAPSFLHPMLSIIFPAPITQIGSLPMTLGMVTTVFLALLVMSKVSGWSFADLGLIKKGWFK